MTRFPKFPFCGEITLTNVASEISPMQSYIVVISTDIWADDSVFYGGQLGALFNTSLADLVMAIKKRHHTSGGDVASVKPAPGDSKPSFMANTLNALQPPNNFATIVAGRIV